MQDWQFSIFPNETFIDLSLYQYGGEVCKPSHLFGPATRNHYLFHYILRGKGVLSANNDKGADIKYHLKAGDGFMIFPGQVTMYIADEQDPWEYMWIEFDGLRVKEALDTVGLTISSPIYHYMYEDLHKEMVKNMVLKSLSSIPVTVWLISICMKRWALSSRIICIISRLKISPIISVLIVLTLENSLNAKPAKPHSLFYLIIG